jgi:hypothetical protein
LTDRHQEIHDADLHGGATRSGPAWNAAIPMRARALWGEHAVFMNALAAEGFVLGGPVGSGRARLAADPRRERAC